MKENVLRLLLKEKREYQTVMKQSSLKMKIALLNKLKAFQKLNEIMKEFEKEDMSKFLKEIVDSLSDNINQGRYSLLIIAIIDFFITIYKEENNNFEVFFKERMVQELKENYGQKLLRWINLFFEICVIKGNLSQEKTFLKLEKLMKKLDPNSRLEFLVKLSIFYKNNSEEENCTLHEKHMHYYNSFNSIIPSTNDIKELQLILGIKTINTLKVNRIVETNETENIKNLVIKSLDSYRSEQYSEITSLIMKNLKEKIQNEESENICKIVCEEKENEFFLYESKKNGIKDYGFKKSDLLCNVNTSKLRKEDEDNIYQIIYLIKKDEITFKQWSSSTHLKLISKSSIPYMTKIMVEMGWFEQFFKKFENKKDFTIKLFLAEFSKHGLYPKSEIVGILENYYKKKKFEHVFALLENMGRFYLINDCYNNSLSKFIVKLKNSKDDFDTLQKLQYKTCIQNILSKKSLATCFLENFYINCIEKKIKLEKEFLNDNVLFILSLKPWIFGNIENFIQIISSSKLLNKIDGVTAKNILISLKEYNIYYSSAYAKFYSAILQTNLTKSNSTEKNHYIEEFEKLFEYIFDYNISTESKVKVLLNLTFYLKDYQNYITEISFLIENSNNKDVKAYYINFLEEKGNKNNEMKLNLDFSNIHIH